MDPCEGELLRAIWTQIFPSRKYVTVQIYFLVMQKENRFCGVSEILFIHEMFNHELHFLKTHTEMYASVYLTG